MNNIPLFFLLNFLYESHLFAFDNFAFFISFCVQAQTDPWIIKASQINPAEYYGITVANGMIGIVSSPEPFKVKDVVLAGAYDQYGRGRVSNFLTQLQPAEYAPGY